jgi:hypothetical protein
MADVFLEFTGDSPTMRVMAYAISCRDLDFCFTDLADNARVSRPTLYKVWSSLVRHKMLVHTRTIGKSKLYKVNLDNQNVRRLVQIYDALLAEELTARSKTTISPH